MLKEMRSSNSGVLVDASSGNAIQTASSEFLISEGKLVPRSVDTNETCAQSDVGGGCDDGTPREVQAANVEGILSSLLDDEDLEMVDSIRVARPWHKAGPRSCG
mmetsp:Transcript_7714/g.15511  ORF Transcript_7714/g.15511 Transcript_7714/m.15511 type:complete len:104 (+) Transcript_7714:225-536(+)